MAPFNASRLFDERDRLELLDVGSRWSRKSPQNDQSVSPEARVECRGACLVRQGGKCTSSLFTYYFPISITCRESWQNSRPTTPNDSHLSLSSASSKRLDTKMNQQIARRQTLLPVSGVKETPHEIETPQINPNDVQPGSRI